MPFVEWNLGCILKIGSRIRGASKAFDGKRCVAKFFPRRIHLRLQFGICFGRSQLALERVIIEPDPDRLIPAFVRAVVGPPRQWKIKPANGATARLAREQRCGTSDMPAEVVRGVVSFNCVVHDVFDALFGETSCKLVHHLGKDFEIALQNSSIDFSIGEPAVDRPCL